VSGVEIDPRTVPELAVVLRANKLSKVRQLDVVCNADHRLVQVIQLPGRGRLVLGIDTTMIHGESDSATRWYWFPSRQGGWAMGRRGRWLGLWLDEPDQEIPTLNGPRLHNRFTFTCAAWHCSEEITLPWLREQVESGRKRTVITDTMHYDMQ
jgi:hypothetical protein